MIKVMNNKFVQIITLYPHNIIDKIVSVIKTIRPNHIFSATFVVCIYITAHILTSITFITTFSI